jgi:hypothetical protein
VKLPCVVAVPPGVMTVMGRLVASLPYNTQQMQPNFPNPETTAYRPDSVTRNN